MKILLKSTLILGLFFSINSCKKQEVDNVTVKYEISITNPKRPLNATLLNENGDNDQVYVSKTELYSKSFSIPSNATKKTYFVDFTCYDYYNYTTDEYESQTVTIKLYEDDKVVSTQTWTGTSYLYSNHSSSAKYVSYQLPTAIKYKK